MHTNITYIDPVTCDEVYYEESYGREELRKWRQTATVLDELVLEESDTEANKQARMMLRSDK